MSDPESSTSAQAGPPSPPTPTLLAALKSCAAPDRKRSLRQLIVTAGLFAVAWLAMVASLNLSYAMTLLLAVAAAGFLVRLFLIQHDCGHGSYFRSRRANDMLGRVIGILTLTPYAYWKRMHAEHHATVGNLDRRGIGDVNTLTVQEYLGLPRWRRLGYRLYRHPLVLFGLGPLYLFVIKNRLPLDLPLRRVRLWLSVFATNAAILAVLVGLAWMIGPINLLKVQLPVTLLASSIGVWLFFVQHQFDGVYWRREGDWRQEDAALHGSSYYSMPKLLQWLTANIGFHHVHHLCSRVPNYRLPEAQGRVPELSLATRVTIMESLRCATLALWDEASAKMIRFSDLKRLRQTIPTTPTT